MVVASASPFLSVSNHVFQGFSPFARRLLPLLESPATMADPNAIASLPQPPTTSAAGFENGAGGHMPPPPLAVNTSMGGFSVGSPTSAGVSRAAPEPVR